MAIFDNISFHLIGTFKGRTQKAVSDLLTEHGASGIVKKADDATHVLIPESDWQTQGTKAAQVTKLNFTISAAGEPKVWVLPLEWALKSIEEKKKLDEAEWDLTAEKKEDEDEKVVDAEEEEKIEEKPKNRNGKGKEKAKRARSPTPTPPPAPAKMVKVVRKSGAPPVDSRFSQATACHVWADPSSGVFYDATLNQTDIKTNANKFYLIQVLKSDTKNEFYTFNVWGRVGENGQQKVSGPFGSPGFAVTEFEKKFKDKSKLTWANRLGPPAAGKYTYLERSFEESEDEEEEEGSKDNGPSPKKAKENDDKAPLVSKLAEPVQSLMQMIFNTTFMASTMSSFEYDASKLPLGKLSKSTIAQGYSALKDIAALLAAGDNRQDEYLRLTNRYLTVIPHAYGRRAPPLLNNPQLLKRELDLVEALGEMKITEELMSTHKSLDEAIHPLDAQCKNLGLKTLDPISPSSNEFKTLQTLISNTKGETHNSTLTIVDAFKIEREEDSARYREKGFENLKNGEKRLLWHGSRSSNYPGILSQGLRIAPPEAPVSGYMFGKGAYLASMSTKSANYTYPQISNGEGLLMLCEAQLGRKPFYKREQAEYEAAASCSQAGFLTTWGIGRTQPAGWEDAEALSPELKGILMPSITKPPAKDVNQSSSLLYDEFIVYDVSQIKLRYLIRVKFNETPRYY